MSKEARNAKALISDLRKTLNESRAILYGLHRLQEGQAIGSPARAKPTPEVILDQLWLNSQHYSPMKLPLPLRHELIERLMDPQCRVREVERWLASRGVRVPKSSLYRYSQAIRTVVADLWISSRSPRFPFSMNPAKVGASADAPRSAPAPSPSGASAKADLNPES